MAHDVLNQSVESRSKRASAPMIGILLGGVLVADSYVASYVFREYSDQHEVATPANWRLGDDVIVPPPKSCASAKERVEKPVAETKALDWFLCPKKCPHGKK